MSYDMYKRRREIEGHNEAESELSGLASGPMREPGAQKERGSSGSWQPRMYECQYCKRGFTSAQALGGHMNVHRRDRAMGKDGFNGSPASNHRRNNISSSDDHVRILQPHGHKRGKSSASFYLDLSSAIIIPYDPTASADVAASSEPSLPVPHGDSRGNGEIKRPELCIHCSSKSSGTHIVDQWHRSDADGEVDLELRL